MVTYVVVNRREKAEFEKKWQIPFGYGSESCIVKASLMEAVEVIDKAAGNSIYTISDYYIERWESGNHQVIFDSGFDNDLSDILYDYQESYSRY